MELPWFNSSTEGIVIMNVLINAISIVKGGGLVVLTHLLESMHLLNEKVTWYVVVGEPQLLLHLPQAKNIIGIAHPWAKKSILHHYYWYEITLIKLIREVNADICFSQTNFLPRRKLPCPSILLIQQAGYFSEKYQQLQSYWNDKKISAILWQQKNKWVHQSIKKATTVTVQTNALAQNITQAVNIPSKKIMVVPHGPGLIVESAQHPKCFPQHKTWRIGYVTKWGVQKDFDTTLRAIYLLKQRGISLKLILTLDENTFHFRKMLHHLKKEIKKYGIQDIVENQGNISSADQINHLYQSLDIFIFPSLCESFGFTLVEAMTAALPMVLADTASNREIVGEAGRFFIPERAEQLVEEIKKLMFDKHHYELASKMSLEQSKKFCWKKTGNHLFNIIQQMVHIRREITT